MIGLIIIVFNTRTTDNYSGILRYASCVYILKRKNKENRRRGRKEFIQLIICIYVIESHNALRQHVMKIKIEIFIKPVEIGHFDWLVNLVLRICRGKN